MNRTQLLSPAAALVLLGAGAASAQAPTKDKDPAQPAPAAQQNAPAEKTAPAVKPGEHKGAETKGQAGKTEMKGTADPAHAQANPPAAGKTETPSGKAEMKGAAATTTGQGAAGAAKLSTEQRSKITMVIRQQKVQKIEPAKLNISINVGTRVPPSVHYYPLPREVVVIYPEWRGYDYILVGDQIVILDPGTHEIVAILDA
ncbi:MAG: DUF1236 domain-containing protein [Pseudolabrys sp.]|nr:DUF1236 domain-containing protein [Pseudolabrys sp.]